MEPQIGAGVAISLIVISAAHITEEALAGFRHFFNTQWFDGNENCPVPRVKGVAVDEIGLLALLACLAVGAGHDARWIFVAVGIITADLVQHVVFSVEKKGYTPGVVTTALYLAYVVYLFAQPETWRLLLDLTSWGALLVGAGFIAINYLFARWRVRQGHCRVAGANLRSNPAIS